MKRVKEVKMPLNLQFFAEAAEPEADTKAAEPIEPVEPEVNEPAPDIAEPEADPKPDNATGPTTQELLAEIAKLKRAQEKAASEAAAYKKKYNEKLSEKEKVDMEKAEREAEREEQFQQLMRENKIAKLEKYYLGELKYTPEEASKMATAEVDEDFDTKLKIQLAVDKRKQKEFEIKFYKERPHLNAGVGDKQITKEQFDAMGIAEKSKLFRENEAEYNRLNGMK